jgi:predicted ATPase
MYREPSRVLAGEALIAIGQVERTLRNMFRDGVRSHCIQVEKRDPDDWWNSWRVHSSTRDIVRETQVREENKTQAKNDTIEYATLGNLWHLFDQAANLFKDLLTDPKRIHDFLSYIGELNDPSCRGRLAHQHGTAPSFDDVKRTIKKSLDIISLIPSKYHDMSGLGGYNDLTESISTAWNKVCQEEETYQHFNFPSQLKKFVGRSNEVKEIQKSILEHRLVTLHGIGGVGKTHIAIHATKEYDTRKLITTFSDGIAFVSLAEASKDASAVRQSISRALGKADEEIGDERALIHLLKLQHLLLLLDNWETVHVTETRALLQQLLTETQHLHILVTSQQLIDIEGVEQVIPIYPLPTLGSLEALDAYSLFLDRARLRLGTDWQPYDTTALQEILQYTDGLPLAIEFVAARIRERPLSELARGLQESRLNVLRQRVGTLSIAPKRHESIETCFEWTYQMLPDEAQVFFPTLGTFVGGFTPEAAAFVGDVKHVQRLLSILDEASLIRLDDRSHRYSLLPMVREYALDKAKDYVDVCRGLHSEYFKNLAVAHGDKERWELQNEDLDILEVEHGNLLAGMDFAYESGDRHSVVAYMRGLRHFFEIRGYWNLSRERLQWGIEAAKLIDDRKSQATFMLNLGVIVEKQDILRGETLYKNALAIWEQLGALGGQAQAWYALGGIEGKRNEFVKAMEFCERSLSFREQSNNKYGQALALHQMGYIAIGMAKEKKDNNDIKGEREYIEKAKDFNMRALKIREEINDDAGIASSSRNLGDVLMRQGQRDEIVYKYYERSLVISEKRGNQQGIAASLHRLGRFFQEEDTDKAHDYFRRSLEIKQKLGNRQDESATLEQLAYLERRLAREEKQKGNSPEAVRHFRAALRYWEQCREIYEDLRSSAVGRIRGEIGRIEKELRRLNV